MKVVSSFKENNQITHLVKNETDIKQPDIQTSTCIQLDLLYSARALLYFIESAHFILYILAIYILVIKITCTLIQ